MRKYLHKMKQSEKDPIQWRSHDITRIEALSDGVIAFTVSILIMSLEVPKTSGEFLNSLKGFIPFIFCFWFLFYIWFEQYKFFRRYGLHDNTTILLNGGLLLSVLFYVYPLKFVTNSWMMRSVYKIDFERDFLGLLCVYHGGWTIIFSLFSAMYYNALTKKDELKLTAIEEFETRSFLYGHLCLFMLGVFMLLIAVLGGRYAFLSMLGYGLIGPVMAIMKSKRRKLFHKKFGNIPMTEPERGRDV